MNQVTLIGRLTKDVELNHTQSGKAVANIKLAIDRPGQDAGTDFPQITVWDKQAENLAKYSGKGLLLAVEGRIQTDAYEKDGKKVYTTKVIAGRVEFLQFKDRTEEAGGAEY